jgi:hypothetical protein
MNRLARSSCLIAGVVLATAARCLATISTQADISGVVKYPATNAEGGIGNQAQIIFQDHSGVITGGASATAQIDGQKGGVDGNGTSGTGGVGGIMIAEIGTLHGKVSASSTSTPNPGPGYVNGEAELSQGGPLAVFRDEAVVSNPSLAAGAPVSVTVHVVLDWTGTLVGGQYAQSAAGAYANMNVAGYVGDTVSFYHDSTGFTNDVASIPLTFSVPNDTTLDVFGQLAMQATVRLVDYADSAYGSATSDALNTAHFYIDGVLPDTTVTSVTGHSYASPIPEPTCAAGAVMGMAALAGRRRR